MFASENGLHSIITYTRKIKNSEQDFKDIKLSDLTQPQNFASLLLSIMQNP